MEIAKSVLRKLDRAGAYLGFELPAKTVTFHADGDSEPVNPADLLILFERGWVSKSETVGLEHRYQITETGRRISRKKSD